jgi:PAS domain S-box-containing protein
MNWQEVMQAVWNTAADGIVISDPDTVILDVNPAYCALTGYTRDELIGQKTNLVRSGLTPRSVYDEMWAALETSGRWSGELINRRPDGSLWISAISITRIVGVNGQVTAYVGLTRDLTESRKLREALAEQSSRLGAIIQAIGNGLLLFDTAGRCVLTNRAALAMLERDEAEVVGASLDQFKRWFGALFREPEPLRPASTEGEWHLSTRREASRFIAATWYPVVAERGESIGQVLLLRDITHEREVDRMKDEFIATVSHELRTPLTALKGSLGLLAGGALGAVPPNQAELLKIALQNTDRLIRMVSDILTLSRMEVGKVKIKPNPHDLNRLAGDVVQELEAVRLERKLTLVTTFAPDLPLIEADGEQIRQVITNLLGNAYKYTPEGGRVEVRTSWTGSEVRLTVQDNGPGIPRDQLERIFDRFTRATSEASRRASGTGLGLAIAKAIVTEHHGRIWAESAPGQGATFQVALPLRQPKAAPTEQ